MSTELLHCCICPKQPRFSDVSHLLTHVSSKGHLSHLHKLQVRSHQERPAARELALYNQWFAEHNVAHMLSERMQQKEIKQAKKRACNKDRTGPTRKRSFSRNVDPMLVSGSNHVKSECYPKSHYELPVALPSQYSPLIYNTYEPMPVHNHDHLGREAYMVRTSHSLSPGGHQSALVESSPQHADGATPEMGKLKGIIWPGMDIFDSADAANQRKRNQRKDVSVLERMQALSRLVQPIETVTSPGGTMKKKRHMDDLEDDSPVEGETTLIKALTRRKRKPLSSISSNVSRQASRRTRFKPALAIPVATPTRNRKMGSPGGCHGYRSLKPARAIQHEGDEFVIFDDHLSGVGVPHINESVSNPFHGTGDRSVRSLINLGFGSTNWTPSTYDPFKEYRLTQNTADTFAVYSDDKENVSSTAWHEASTIMLPNSEAALRDNFADFGDGFSALAEVYAFTRNPLYNPICDQASFDDISLPDHKSVDPTTPVYR